MRKATAATRLAVLKGAVVAGVLATAALATGTASAQIFVLTPSPNTGANGAALASAITQANTNGGSNTIVFGSPGTWAPTSQLPTITDPNLTFTSDHSVQAVNGGAPVIAGSGDTADQPLIVVAAAGGLTAQGVDLRALGVANGGFPGMEVAGAFTAYDTAIQANNAEAAIQIDSTGTATLDETLVSDNLGFGLDNEGGTLNLNNDTVVRNFGGINNNGTTNATNSIFSTNTGNVGLTNCSATLNSSGSDVDSDSSCVAAGDTTSKTGATQTLGQTRSNGGPTPTIAIPTTAGSTNPALGLGNPMLCAVTDQRFFTHTGTGCDAGSYQSNGTQVTTPPACPGPGVITKNGSGQNVSQQITVTDGTGFGPEGGAISDLSNTQAAVTLGNDQADAVDGVTIDNGTVGASPFSSSGSSSTPIQVTATKATLTSLTHWSFYTTAWDGLTTFCH